MEEKDSDYFFGRSVETVEVLNALAAPDRLAVLIGDSGVGKSSLAQAGVLAALKRQAWPEEAHAPNGPVISSCRGSFRRLIGFPGAKSCIHGTLRNGLRYPVGTVQHDAAVSIGK
jgi:hypothetical protein